MLELRKLKKALTGKKYIQGAFQRVVGWCETIRPIVSNTFRELRTEHFSRLRREAHVITLGHNDVPDEAVVRKNAVNRGGTTINIVLCHSCDRGLFLCKFLRFYKNSIRNYATIRKENNYAASGNTNCRTC